jgi:CRP-like cAMP-binding protein
MRKVLYLFGQLDDGDVQWMIDRGRRRFLPRGEDLIRQGVPSEAVFILLRGKLSVTLPNLGGREIARLGVGEIVGEMSFVDARPPSATVTGLEDSTVFAIHRAELEDKLARDLGFAARFYRALAIYLSTTVRERHRALVYGDAVELPEEAPGVSETDPDELDGTILDGVYLAGERFDRMLKEVLGA